MLRLYKIRKKVSKVNYKLKLLKGSRVHLIFYVLLFKKVAGIVKTSINEIRLKHKLNIYNVKKILNNKISNKG